jgi:hypothetical protein
MGLGFEWTIRAGDLLTFIGGVCVAAAFLYRRGGSDTELKLAVTACLKEVSEMKAELSEFGRAMTKLAVQETKIDLLMKWYDELRRGEGFVKGTRGIDREYP